MMKYFPVEDADHSAQPNLFALLPQCQRRSKFLQQVSLKIPGDRSKQFSTRKYKFVVKNRKGFVKVALRNGSPPLVPAVSFGETDLFDQLVQEFIRKSLGVASVIINGRGFFQCSFGIIPRKQPVTTVGKIFVSTHVVLL
jgi:hypothetical protein